MSKAYEAQEESAALRASSSEAGRRWSELILFLILQFRELLSL